MLPYLTKAFRIWFPFIVEKSQLFFYGLQLHLPASTSDFCAPATVAFFLFLKHTEGEFPGSPVVRTQLPMPGAHVWSLVGKLRSCKLHWEKNTWKSFPPQDLCTWQSRSLDQFPLDLTMVSFSCHLLRGTSDFSCSDLLLPTLFYPITVIFPSLFCSLCKLS